MTNQAPFVAGDVVKEKAGETGIGGRGGNTYLVTDAKWLDFGDGYPRWSIHVRRWIKTTKKYSGTVYSLHADRLEKV